MRDLYTACTALYDIAFPGENPDFRAALFASYCPEYLRAISENGKILSMLFSIPYEVKTVQDSLAARYLYAVATHPEARGKGLATKLLREESASGAPVFLRPMRQELFSFYRKAGLVPFSHYITLTGTPAEKQPYADTDGRPADADSGASFAMLTAGEYRIARRKFLTPPYAEPSRDFLSLSFLSGGAIGSQYRFCALYERDKEEILFKEWLGDPAFLPSVTAFLGGQRYVARCYAGQEGKPFGVGANLPDGTRFLLAID